MEAQLEHVRIAYTFFARLAPAQSVLINKISASELSRKFIKSPLSVGSTLFFPELNLLFNSPFSLRLLRGAHRLPGVSVLHDRRRRPALHHVQEGRRPGQVPVQGAIRIQLQQGGGGTGEML